MKFKKAELQALVSGESTLLERVHSAVAGATMWFTMIDIVFKDAATDKLYRTSYRVATANQQDELPFEHDWNEIDCQEVKPVPVEVRYTIYEPVK